MNDDPRPRIFTFERPGFGTAVFGPYRSEHEAKTAFQRIYGFWPADAIKVEEWQR